VTNSGSSSAAILNFTIPSGAAGAPGATGPTGPQGPQGTAGGSTNWRGTWSSVTAYAINDAIASAGSSYIATAASTNQVPPNVSYWSLLAQAGTAGATGATGATGAAGANGTNGTNGSTGPTGPTGPSGTSALTTLGDILYENGTPAPARLAGNTTSALNFLCQTGTGSISAAPGWCALISGDIPNNAANTSGTAAGLSGTPALPNGTTATTQTPGDNSTKVATTAFVLANGGSGGSSVGAQHELQGAGATAGSFEDSGVAATGGAVAAPNGYTAGSAGSPTAIYTTTLLIGSLPAASGFAPVTTGSDVTYFYRQVSDGTGASDCTVGGGSNLHWCVSNGTTWISATGPSSLSAYVTLTDGSPITWATGGIPVTNAKVTLAHATSTRALNLSGLVNGAYGTLFIFQDATGGANITGGTGCTWYVSNPAGGFTATSTFFATAPGASSVNLLTWSSDGTNCYVGTH
jgi:hypothetical protein